MKSSNIFLILTAVCILTIIALVGCGGDEGSATVILTLSGVPSSCTKITLTVTGVEMDTISGSYTPDTLSVTVDVPAGPLRVLTVLAECPSVYFRASTSRSLDAGETVSIDLTLELYETKLIIPDAENNRVVQIDDMSGAGWKELNWDDLTSSSTELGFTFDYEFAPYDIDFDSQGRIYIANYAQSGDTSEGVLRVDDINDTEYDNIISQGISSIAIDRANGWLYYTSSGPELTRSNLEGVSDTDYSSVVSPSDVSGLAVDETGMVYATLLYEGNSVIKFDPENTSDTIGDGVSGYPEDIIVKTPYAYVVDSSTPALRTYAVDDLTEGTPYGSQDDGEDPDDPGEFFGPRRFVAPVNKKLYIIDHDFFERKLVALEDSTGVGWETYGTAGTGVGQFKFYSTC